MKKKITLLITALAFTGVLSINAEELNPENKSQEVKTELKNLPYSLTPSVVPMVPIVENNEYVVYRTEAELVGNVPSCEPVGVKYNYFVYKNGNFHLTVNQCNKDKVFQYFAN